MRSLKVLIYVLFRSFRKDLMVKNVKRYKKEFEKENPGQDTTFMDFVPNTFTLPAGFTSSSLSSLNPNTRFCTR